MPAIPLTAAHRKRLRKARESHGLTPAELAARLGVSRPYLAMLEAGQKKPSDELLPRWAAELGLAVAVETRVRFSEAWTRN